MKEETLQELRSQAAYHRIQSIEIRNERLARYHYRIAVELHDKIRRVEVKLNVFNSEV